MESKYNVSLCIVLYYSQKSWAAVSWRLSVVLRPLYSPPQPSSSNVISHWPSCGFREELPNTCENWRIGRRHFRNTEVHLILSFSKRTTAPPLYTRPVPCKLNSLYAWDIRRSWWFFQITYVLLGQLVDLSCAFVFTTFNVQFVTEWLLHYLVKKTRKKLFSQ